MTRRACYFFVVSLLCAPLGAREYIVCPEQIGPDPPLAELNDVPWESLAPGDTVSVCYRPQPYRSKIILAVQATQDKPLVLRGLPGPNGELPVIDGREATTRVGINFWGETRGLLKIGGSNWPACSPPECVPSWITVENLELRSARPPYTFTGRSGQTTYDQNAAALYIEVGRNIAIRNCRLRDSGNGLFIGVFGGETKDILVEGNHIFENGNEDSIYEHNSYTAARGIVFQYNYYGSLRAGCLGNNLKDRSAGLVVRYNWIENGNRQLDLVDGEDSMAVPNDPLYRQTFVYGNVLVEAEGEGNSQIVHYGGDSGNTSIYRKGTLYFYHNTVISTRTGNTTLFRLSTNEERCDARNNIVWVTAAGSRLAMLDSNGVLDLSHNLFKTGWVASHSGLSGTINDDGSNISVTDAGFVDLASQDFHLAPGSPAIDQGGPLAAAVANYPVERQYVRHQKNETRPQSGPADIGAFEYVPAGGEDGGQDAGDGGYDAADAGQDAADADQDENDGGTDAGRDGGDMPDESDAIAQDGDADEEAQSIDDARADGSGGDGNGAVSGSCGCASVNGGVIAPLVLLVWLVAGRLSRKRC